jgi:spore coat protein U-like protein
LTGGGLCHAAPATVQVSATIPSNHNCKFNSNAAVALDFGTLNPLLATNVTRTATIDFECTGNKNLPVFYSIADDDGLNETGSNANRMKHVTLGGPNAFIPYSFSVSPVSGSTPLKTPVILTITGTILGPAYEMAYEGVYNDTVIVSIVP